MSGGGDPKRASGHPNCGIRAAADTLRWNSSIRAAVQSLRGWIEDNDMSLCSLLRRPDSVCRRLPLEVLEPRRLLAAVAAAAVEDAELGDLFGDAAIELEQRLQGSNSIGNTV